MTYLKTAVSTLIVSACFSLSAFAPDKEQQQTLELETADVAVLQLATVENEADKNSNEVHQEATVGRAGLAGNCTTLPPFPGVPSLPF
jgi:hypothetical protein